MRTRLQRHLGSRQVARMVHGSIIGLALVVIVESHPSPDGRRGGQAAVITLVGVALITLEAFLH